MDVSTASLVYFSPTGTTRRVLEAIAWGTGADVAQRVDLTPPDSRVRPLPLFSHGLALIGAPVYGGRVPAEAVRRLRRLGADSVPAVVVAVYGNRAYEDALLELRDIAAAVGFTPVAGGAFIGEHSFDSQTTPIATGRPDAEDQRVAAEFGAQVKAKVAAIGSLGEIGPLQVPGSFPYKPGGEGMGISPVSRVEVCACCGTCVTVCPTGAIALDGAVETDAAACIMCSACVKACPSGARTWEAEWVQRAAQWLSTEHGKRKEPDLFL